jgi:hypothetical protein
MNDRIDNSVRAIACTLISSGAPVVTDEERRLLAFRAHDIAEKLEFYRDRFIRENSRAREAQEETFAEPGFSIRQLVLTWQRFREARVRKE